MNTLREVYVLLLAVQRRRRQPGREHGHPEDEDHEEHPVRGVEPRGIQGSFILH